MKTSLGRTFEGLKKLHLWLRKFGLIKYKSTPLYEWVEDNQEKSLKPSDGILWINSDCSPTVNDCVDIINGALEKLKEQQSAINGVKYCGCDDTDTFYFAELGLPNDKYLIYRSNTLERLKNKRFSIRIEQEKKKEEKEEKYYKLVITVTEQGESNEKKLSYQLHHPWCGEIDADVIKSIETVTVSFLSNDQYTLEGKKNSNMIREVLCTSFMKMFLRVDKQNSNLFKSPFASEMRVCLGLDENQSPYKEEGESLNDKSREVIFLVNMSQYLKLLSNLIKGDSTKEQWADYKSLDRRGRLSYHLLLDNTKTVNNYLENELKCAGIKKEDIEIKRNIEKVKEIIRIALKNQDDHIKSRKSGINPKKDTTIIYKLKEQLREFIVAHYNTNSDWSNILIYKSADLNDDGSLYLMTYDKTSTNLRPSNWSDSDIKKSFDELLSEEVKSMEFSSDLDNA